MKTLFIAVAVVLFVYGGVARAGIIDSNGYVTNAAYLNSFPLTNSDGSVSNAVMVKVLPNKFFYNTPDGVERAGKWSEVSTNVQAEFGYDPAAAAAADGKEQALKTQEFINGVERAKFSADRAVGDAAIAEAEKSRTDLFGSVIQIVPDGLLVMLDDWLGGQVVIVEDCDTAGKADGDRIEAYGYPIGTYSYTTTQGAEKTIHAFTLDLNRAAKRYLPVAPIQGN